MLDILAPPLCWSCSSPGAPLCRACARRVRRLPSELVPIAGVPCFAPTAYEGPARDLVRALKFHGARGVAGAMAATIVAMAPGGLLAETALVPVPLAPARRRRRGFNQAHVLAAALAERTGCAVVAALQRRGGGSQVGRGRAERARALRGAIEAVSAPEHAVIVDDVATTGATLAACASALREAGSKRVLATTYARTVGR